MIAKSPTNSTPVMLEKADPTKTSVIYAGLGVGNGNFADLASQVQTSMENANGVKDIALLNTINAKTQVAQMRGGLPSISGNTAIEAAPPAATPASSLPTMSNGR